MGSLGSSKVPPKSLRGGGFRPLPATATVIPLPPEGSTQGHSSDTWKTGTFSHTQGSGFASAHPPPPRRPDSHLLTSSSSAVVFCLRHGVAVAQIPPHTLGPTYLPVPEQGGRHRRKPQAQRGEERAGQRARAPPASTRAASADPVRPQSRPQPHAAPSLPPRTSRKPLFVLGSPSGFPSQRTLPVFEPALRHNHFPRVNKSL